jgi:hypothetical protein
VADGNTHVNTDTPQRDKCHKNRQPWEYMYNRFRSGSLGHGSVYRLFREEMAELQECVLPVIWSKTCLINYGSFWHSYQYMRLFNVALTTNFLFYSSLLRRAVAQLVEALRYTPESHGFDCRWCQWNWLHYGPRVDSASNRNEYQEYFLGGKGDKCIGLTTLPPSCAECLVIWKPQPPEPSGPCPGL